MRLVGASYNFESTTQNGVQSENFASWFPKAFEFWPHVSTIDSEISYCTDLSIWILSIFLLVVFGLAWIPGITAFALLMITNGFAYYYIIFVGDPPSPSNYPSMLARSLTEVFILLVLTYFVFEMSAKDTFDKWKDHCFVRVRVITWACYIVPYTIALHLNVFANIPWLNVDFGGYAENQIATIGTIIVYSIAAIIFVLLLAWHLRQLYKIGRFLQYVIVTITIVITCVSVWVMLPSSYGIHLHHATLGLIITLLARLPNRLSIFCLGIGMGLLVNGYTRYDWDPIFEYRPLRQQLPIIPQPVVNSTFLTSSSVNLYWNASGDARVIGYALMINDAEMYRGIHASTNVDNLRSDTEYFTTVAALGDSGVDEFSSENATFRTLASSRRDVSRKSFENEELK